MACQQNVVGPCGEQSCPGTLVTIHTQVRRQNLKFALVSMPDNKYKPEKKRILNTLQAGNDMIADHLTEGGGSTHWIGARGVANN